MTRAVLLVAFAAAALGGCRDPVHDDVVAALGPEDPSVPPGPLHRPGQPCLACHDGTGPASLAFGTAGTVFQDVMNPYPLVAATVVLTDAVMNVSTAETNCAGNFFLEAVDWNPAFPVHVQVTFGNQSSQMQSHMGKADSCATCHVGVVSPSTVPQVYLNYDPMQYPSSGCQ
jgi:hypothetical protein